MASRATQGVEMAAQNIPYALKAANFAKYHVPVLWLACEARLMLPCPMSAVAHLRTADPV